MKNWLSITLMIIGLPLFFFLILWMQDVGMDNWLFGTIIVMGIGTYLFFIARLDQLNECQKPSKDNIFSPDRSKLMSIVIFRDILAIIVGIGLIISNVITYIGVAELIKHEHETTAVVTELRRVYRGRWSGNSTHVIVQYTIDGVIYSNRLDITDGITYIGEEMVILYSPNNPNKITSIDRDRALDTPGLLILKSVGGALLILLCVPLGWTKRKKSKYKYKW